MNKDHIPNFPNKMPQVNWQRNLHIFQHENVDDALLHLIKFHIHSWKLKVEWHEYFLMKMFMETLEGQAREWYERLNPGSLFSIKDFHWVIYENYKEYSPSLSLAENYSDQYEDLIQYLENIDEDIGNMHDEDLLEEIYGSHSQVNCHDNQENLVEDERNQEIKVDPQDLFVDTNDNSYIIFYEAKEDIQSHDQYSQEKEKNCCLIQRKQRLPPPLIEEEINQILSMQPTSQYLCDQNINPICSTIDLCTKVFTHEEIDVEQIDTDVVLCSQQGLLSENSSVHKNDGLQIEFSQLSRDISGLLEEKILVYSTLR